MRDNPAPDMARNPSLTGEDIGAPSSREEVISGSVPGISPYVIFALPRSRTAWLSHFLTHGEWVCGHEELRHMRSLEDVKAWFRQPCTGTIETAGAFWWRLLEKLAPGTRVVVVRRPVGEVIESLMAIPGCTFDRGELEATMGRLDRKLDQIEARIANVVSVRFDDLSNEATCAALFEYCTGQEHDRDRWEAMAPINIQVNMRALIRYCAAYRPALEKMAAVAKHRTMTTLAMRKPTGADNMTIQTEPFDDWLTDAGRVLAEHHAQIGEAPGNWQNKNIPLLRTMFEMGAMQITTARSNGRMFGYLMTLLAPSLADEGVMTAVNTAFFADPACPGLGLKLQRAALVSFRDQGIGEVLWETNTVGSGNRISSIYRRLGAEEKGSVYRLKLAEAA